MTVKRVVVTAVLAAGIACTGMARAADPEYPSRTVRLVVANLAGGTSDILARLIGAKLADTWKQQFIVDNRPGASGLIGNELVVKSPPDGYTYLVADLGSTTITSLTRAKPTYDLARGFSPVTIISYSPHLFCVHPSVPVSNIKQLIALAKAQPGKLNFSTAGQTSAPHFAALLFMQRTGVTWEFIPGKGGAQAVLDLVTGQADITMNGMLATLPHVKSGKLKLIAVSSEKRNPELPNALTIQESGVPDFVTGSWQGILAPAKTPPEIIAKMQAETKRVLFAPEMKSLLSKQGAEPMGSTPEETTAFMNGERERWGKLIRDTGYKLQ
jgi:tripartite-type tricarboxylate transporter receptor subunit TctC